MPFPDDMHGGPGCHAITGWQQLYDQAPGPVPWFCHAGILPPGYPAAMNTPWHLALMSPCALCSPSL